MREYMRKYRQKERKQKMEVQRRETISLDELLNKVEVLESRFNMLIELLLTKKVFDRTFLELLKVEEDADS